MLKVAAWLERAWTHLLAVLGVVVLALSPLYLDWLRTEGSKLEIGDSLAVAILIVAGVTSVAGVLFGVARYEKAMREMGATVMIELRASLVPVVERLLMVPAMPAPSELEDVMTEVAGRIALFAKKDDDRPDANIYYLKGDTCLERLNRSGGTARKQFLRTRKRTPEALEERYVIERVLAGQVTVCEDVLDPKNREKLHLAAVERRYRSFISVPVILKDGSPYGMISLNSAKKNGLRSLHISYLENIAGIIGKIEAVNPSPNTTDGDAVVQNGDKEADR